MLSSKVPLRSGQATLTFSGRMRWAVIRASLGRLPAGRYVCVTFFAFWRFCLISSFLLPIMFTCRRCPCLPLRRIPGPAPWPSGPIPKNRPGLTTTVTPVPSARRLPVFRTTAAFPCFRCRIVPPRFGYLSVSTPLLL
jgi:hypothetical protein